MSLVSHFPLHGNAKDVEGTNDGVNNGATSVSGILGNGAYDFNGTDSAITFGDVFPFSDADQFSYSAWINLDTVSPSNNMLLIGNLGRRRNLQISTGGNLRLRGYDGSSQVVSANTTLSTGTWFFTCVTFDGSTAALYLDGVDDGSGSFNYNEGSYDDWFSRTNTSSGKEQPLDGRMSNIRIYDHALSPLEVQYLYETSEIGEKVSEKVTL